MTGHAFLMDPIPHVDFVVEQYPAGPGGAFVAIEPAHSSAERFALDFYSRPSDAVVGDAVVIRGDADAVAAELRGEGYRVVVSRTEGGSA